MERRRLDIEEAILKLMHINLCKICIKYKKALQAIYKSMCVSSERVVVLWFILQLSPTFMKTVLHLNKFASQFTGVEM